MNYLKKFVTFLVILTLGAFVLSFSKSTGKITSVPVKESREAMKLRMSLLLDRMFAESDGSDFAAIDKDYEALNAEEYAVWKSLKFDWAKARMKESGYSERTIEVKLAEAAAFITSVEEIAAKNFGVAFNKLSNEQERAAIEEAEKALDLKNKAANATIAPALACTLIGYPYTTTPGSGGVWWFTIYRTVNTPGETPCDYEYHYSGYRDNLSFGNWVSNQAGSGGYCIFNWWAGNTHMLVGWGSVEVYLVGLPEYFHGYLNW